VQHSPSSDEKRAAWDEAGAVARGIIPRSVALIRMKRLVLLGALGALALPMTHAAETKTESLVLGGGCFWCTDAAYKLLPGVKAVTCGYAGGKEPNPTYEQVCDHATGHAEVVKIDFDPAVVSLDRLLSYFWQVHNPTQVDGQGNDHGPQYRSIILYADAVQKVAAEKSQAAAAKVFRDPIVTQIVPLTKFWAAEDYHQNYFAKHPNEGYCAVVIAPKIRKLEHQLADQNK
jgi:peptide-methionine (S)-S-oxide reductase